MRQFRFGLVSAVLVSGTVLVSACSSDAAPGDESAGDPTCEGPGCATTCTPPEPACTPGSSGAPGVKCGRGQPALCADGVACGDDGDCASDYCDGACSAPAPGANADGRRNAGESDVDCGGPNAPDCEAGKTCVSADDCTSSCTNGVCDAPGSADKKKNNDETDVDCGGPNAPKCVVGKVCTVSADCGLGWCKDGACAVPSVSDAVQNGTETDVDCGGAAQTEGAVSIAAAPRCALAQGCAVDGDCTSSICSAGGRCVEAPSCRPVLGGYTCGAGEVGSALATHESCCKSLPVPGLTMVQNGATKQVYLDKYEITAGRIRAWITAIKAQYGGVPNIKAWITARVATDPILAAQFPGTWKDYLPAQASGQLASFPVAAALQPKYGGQTTVNLDLGLDSQLGPTSYYRDVQVAGTDGCFMGAGAYGHRTYWYEKALSDSFQEVFRDTKDVLDVKSMNCITPIMFQAFCAWDGGYMQSQAAISTAYGPSEWPWGATPTPKDDVAKMANYNAGVGNFGNTVQPRYLFPVVNYGTFANDFTPIIASPGRFPKDVASQTRPNGETWMDLGGNMIEWSQVSGTIRGWTGSSFEGHFYPRAWTGNVYFLDKYGKGGTRCMRLR